MSHITQIQTLIQNEDAVRRACHELQLPQPTRGTFQLYSGNAAGLGVQLNGWRYPLVINTDSGTVKYDNYNGAWGASEELDKFSQRYTLEVGRMSAESQNLSYEEFVQANGDTVLRTYLDDEVEQQEVVASL